MEKKGNILSKIIFNGAYGRNENTLRRTASVLGIGWGAVELLLSKGHIVKLHQYEQRERRDSPAEQLLDFHSLRKFRPFEGGRKSHRTASGGGMGKEFQEDTETGKSHRGLLQEQKTVSMEELLGTFDNLLDKMAGIGDMSPERKKTFAILLAARLYIDFLERENNDRDNRNLEFDRREQPPSD